MCAVCTVLCLGQPGLMMQADYTSRELKIPPPMSQAAQRNTESAGWLQQRLAGPGQYGTAGLRGRQHQLKPRVKTKLGRSPLCSGRGLHPQPCSTMRQTVAQQHGMGPTWHGSNMSLLPGWRGRQLWLTLAAGAAEAGEQRQLPDGERPDSAGAAGPHFWRQWRRHWHRPGTAAGTLPGCNPGSGAISSVLSKMLPPTMQEMKCAEVLAHRETVAALRSCIHF